MRTPFLQRHDVPPPSPSDPRERDRFNELMGRLHIGTLAGEHNDAFVPRESHLPIGAFRDPADVAREFFVRWRWVAIVVLALALIGAVLTRSDLPNL